KQRKSEEKREIDQKQKKSKPISFLLKGGLKEEEKASKREDKETPIFTMKEVHPENPEIPIHRAEPYPSEKEEDKELNTQSNREVDSTSVEEESTPLEASKSKANAKKPQKIRSQDIEQLELDQSLEEKEYVFPPINLLSKPTGKGKGMSNKALRDTAIKLQETLESFGVGVSITNVSCGPAVTRYEIQPEHG